MSAYIYAIIPYKSGLTFDTNEPYPFAYGFVPSELRGMDSEFIDEMAFEVFSDFIIINTCYRQSAFTNSKDGYNWM